MALGNRFLRRRASSAVAAALFDSGTIRFRCRLCAIQIPRFRTNPHGYLQISATANVALSSFVTVHGSASFDTHGNFCIDSSVQVAGFSGTVSICGPGEPNPGIHAHFHGVRIHDPRRPELADVVDCVRATRRVHAERRRQWPDLNSAWKNARAASLCDE